MVVFKIPVAFQEVAGDAAGVLLSGQSLFFLLRSVLRMEPVFLMPGKHSTIGLNNQPCKWLFSTPFHGEVPALRVHSFMTSRSCSIPVTQVLF